MDSKGTLGRLSTSTGIRTCRKVFKCHVSGCEDSEKEFKIEAALKSHIRNVHPEYEGGGAREVPIVEENFTTAELVRDKRMDIMRKASYVLTTSQL